EGTLFKVCNHMGWNTEYPADFRHLKLPCFKELCLRWIDGNRCIFHTFFQYSHLIGICRTTKGLCPAFPYLTWVFKCSRMLKHTTWCSPIRIEFTSILLCCDTKTDCILGHSDWRISNQTVKG